VNQLLARLLEVARYAKRVRTAEKNWLDPAPHDLRYLDESVALCDEHGDIPS